MNVVSAVTMKYIGIVQNDAGVLLLLFFGSLLPSYVPVMSVFRIAIAALKSHINQITFVLCYGTKLPCNFQCKVLI